LALKSLQTPLKTSAKTMGCCCAKYDKPKELKSKHFPAFFQTLPKMDGKVVAVTGCTTGTGFVCAKACAQLGATVVLLNRSSERSEAAEKAIKEEAPQAFKLFTVHCDLQSFSSVRKAAEKLREEFAETGIDVLCNNAGIMAVADQATADGCCVQMQTNHLSHFLLTKELWPMLEKAAELRGEARVVNHSSLARKGKKLDKKYLGKNGGNLGGDKRGCAPFGGPRWDRYQQTKLANLAFTLALRDRAEKASSKVKCMVAEPGVAATNLQVTTVRDGGMGSCLSNTVVSQTAEDGAIGITLCCCQPDAKSGSFYGPNGLKGMAKLLPPGPEEKLADQASRDMLWSESEAVTGVQFTV